MKEEEAKKEIEETTVFSNKTALLVLAVISVAIAMFVLFYPDIII